MRLYEQRQTKNRHLRDERIHYVYTHVSGYQKLDESVATLSVAQGKKMLNGDPNALSELKECLHKLTKDKQRLLNARAFPPIFWSRFLTALTPGYRICGWEEMPLLPPGGNRASLSAVQIKGCAGKRKF